MSDAIYASRSKKCCDIGLLDPNVIRSCVQYYSTVCEFLLYQMEGRKVNGPFITTIHPQHLKPTAVFSALPEWYIEDIADFLLFAMQFCPEQMVLLFDQSIITWVLTCVCAPHCIRNPYITAKLVEVLFVTSPSIQRTSSLQVSVSLRRETSEGTAHEFTPLQIMNHELAQTDLIGALMKFYTDIETTGQSTEFYDKFTIR